MSCLRVLSTFLLLVTTAVVLDAAEPAKVIKNNGRYQLLVDGKPFFILGAQINNSSSWPSTLPKVWPAVEAMHANTVEAPVYWEQIEPQPGSFDFAHVDELVQGARQHHIHLVVLWFGTWKNGQMHYVPDWVKNNPARYPRMIDAQGEPIDVLSANAPANLEADRHAFVALMHHLRQIDDAQHTVLFVQVENESGAIGTVRDFSPEANREFAGQVPAPLLKALGKQPGTWPQVFGREADEYFQAYYQARYIDAIAAAGKREFLIPLYINVWVSYPVAELPERRISFPGVNYPSGGAIQKMVDLWKAMAPSIDFIGPDIYSDDSDFYRQILATYQRPDNPLWIPETGLGDSFARYLFYVLGDGGIGFSPFGIDWTGWTLSEGEVPKLHAENYALLAPMDRQVAELAYAGKLKTAVEEPGQARQEIDFGQWQATASFGFPQHDGRKPPGTSDYHGRVLVAELGPDEFLVTGFDASVSFHLPSRLPGKHMQILKAEEGTYTNGEWKPLRNLNGDETDRGLIFKSSSPQIVHIKLSRF